MTDPFPTRTHWTGVALLPAALLAGGCDGPDRPTASRTPDVGAVAGATPAVRAGRAAPRAFTVMAFGDSLYAGYGLRRGEGLPAAIESRLRSSGMPVTVVDAGVNGETTAGGRRRLAATLDRQGTKPDLVLLGLGGNDALRLVDPAETRANLVAMLDELDRRGIPVVLTGMMVPPQLAPSFARRFNAIWPELARDHGAVRDPFILAGVIGNRQLMLSDGVHPNARGVARMADRLVPLVSARLGEIASTASEDHPG